MKEQFQSLAEAYGYLSIESKNPLMWSYRNESQTVRINYYFTTGTLTIQYSKSNKPLKNIKRIFSDVDFEEILINNKKYE